MEKIVIVLGDRKNPHAHHIKLEGTVRIGRALSSDVILSDEHVEPLQLVFFEAEGLRKVEVKPGINPVFRNGEQVHPGIHEFISGDEWNMGHTRLQAFHENHIPEPTEKLVMQEYRGSSLTQIAVFVATVAALFGWILFSNWIADYEPFEWSKKLAQTAADGYLIMVFVWAAFWGITGRLVAGRNQFVIHFVAASLFVLVDMLITPVEEYLSYGTNHELAWTLLNYAVMALILAMLMYSAFSYALNMRHTKMVALAVGVFFSGMVYFDSIRSGNELEPQFNHHIKPPFALLVKPDNLEQFNATMDDAFEEVDELLEE